MSKSISCLLTTHNKENLIESVCNGILNNISELKETFISISFTSAEGIQNDLSTSAVDFCDIKKL